MQPVHLRQTRNTDLDYVLAAEHGEDNRPFIIPWTREQHLQAMADRDCAHLIAEANTKVGYVILAGLLDPNRSVEFRRIVITDKGQGYGRAVITLVKELVFDTYKAHRLWLDVKEQNARARQLYQQSGFIVEGTLRECLRRGTGYDSLVIMSVLQREHENCAQVFSNMRSSRRRPE
jgi:diamine N-acetyltransferase